jgi:hypothetical protein
MSEKLQMFVDNIKRIHDDNTELEHFAKSKNSQTSFSTMPITAFIYEFFIYNSLYSVDWKESIKNNQISSFREKGTKEEEQQNKFVNYLKEIAKDNLGTFKLSFQKLADENIEDKWTDVDPDNKANGITIECGKAFFENLKVLQSLIKSDKPFTEERLNKAIPRILDCIKFIYRVRCNIFHGSKHIGETKYAQKKHIEVYHLFLNCLVSSFLQHINKTIQSAHSHKKDEDLATS